ncbi:histidinol-phosphate transaminase [Candidatus Beckwithbacteria bacterium CG10_big_fil_rev_8_21_14_0_10_34_10]|uniref:Histidinol-phosphate transaminase n=1 Tax=Candidatus Beckwithbacteria bacterium CG10_big_fil_rev_8_21_14_0_10_34_10 TaxID=1974495 RepID=A0A2H0WC01_9BACT|nr:MAG: histidinol-phosphate transaminase [Candidatus Beckwithbacteria bacterium CG10_big_fil_rev_8_21_14_0_10_34_10]
MNKTQLPSFRNLYAFGKKLPIDLSLSENPLGCSPKVSRVLEQLTQADFFDYPDPDCNQLKKAIAKRFQIKVECIFVANGSEAIIKLLPQVLLKPGDKVIIPKLTFPMFDVASKMSRGKVISSEMTPNFDIDLDDVKSKIDKNTKLIFLCNPNNPTGRVISKKKIVDFVQSTKAIVVVDEANIEFGGKTVIREVNRLKNLIVLRTFSKAFGLAGFRIGFCVASKEIIQLLEQASQPFPVSTIAEKVALMAFKDTKFIKKTREFMNGERNFLSRELEKRSFKVIKSQANNLLVKVSSPSSKFIDKLNEKGVSVVNGSFFNLEKASFIRVSPRLRKTNKKFIEVIDKILAK